MIDVDSQSVIVRVDSETLGLLRAAARVDGLSLGQIIRAALTAYLRVLENQASQSPATGKLSN